MLSDADRSILDFEGQWWSKPGAKEQAVRDLFGMSMARHLQNVNRLLDDPEALAYAPLTVKRLARLRARRLRAS